MKPTLFLLFSQLPCLWGCTAIVNATLESSDAAAEPEEDGEADDALEEEEEEEAGPDFDTDTCGLWGRMYIEDPMAVNLRSEIPETDGNGNVSYNIVGWTTGDGRLVYDTFLEQEISVVPDHYYCLAPDLLSGLDRAFIVPSFLDTLPDSVTNDVLAYRSIIIDPLDLLIMQVYILRPSDLISANSNVFWQTGGVNRMDFALKARVSTVSGTVGFSEAFPTVSPAGLNARICLAAIVPSPVDDPDLKLENIGWNYIDLTDSDVTKGAAVSYSLNVAALPDQVFAVIVYYIEGREAVSSLTSECGDSLRRRSCASACMSIGQPQIGEENPLGAVITIEPISARCTVDTFPCP